MVKDICPGAPLVPAQLTNVGGTLYFTANDGAQRPRAVEERRHGRRHGDGQGHLPGRRRLLPVSNLTNVNGTLFFTANDGTHGIELWKSDGTAAGTMMVKDI